jgi:hypothetical protein
MNLLIQMATIDVRCWSECMTLGRYQTDYDGSEDDVSEEGDSESGEKGGEPRTHGCKLRPDEGLDAISSLAPGSISSNLLVGGTNTVYAWLIQWLADNLGYDVTSIVALPYDWRLSPDKMESRDGFLTMMRMKIEAAVKSNGLPGILVAHSMGNSVFRYFQEWLRVQMRDEAYDRYVQQAEQRAASRRAAAEAGNPPPRGPFWRGRAWVRNNIPGVDEYGSDSLDDAILEEMDSVESTMSDLRRETGKNTDKQKKEEDSKDETDEAPRKYPKLWDLAKMEGDAEWIDWLGKHVWTYVGLAAPLLGAPGPLRSVLSGENMGLPFTDEEARILELCEYFCSLGNRSSFLCQISLAYYFLVTAFGSTSTVNPISTKMGFCDVETRGNARNRKQPNRSNLACLDELVSGIEASRGKTDKDHDPWEDFPALKLLLKDRVDHDTGFPMIRVEREYCKDDEKSPCGNQTTLDFGPEDVMDGRVFEQFSKIWNEEGDPMRIKYEQLKESWWETPVKNFLTSPPDRPHIKVSRLLSLV